MTVDGPADCLRSLAAGALIRSRSEGDLLPMSLGLQATANAFVTLGLLPEDGAESCLAVLASVGEVSIDEAVLPASGPGRRPISAGPACG